MILVKDLDLVAGLANRHAPVLGPEMLKHASFENPEIPTTIFVDWWKRLLLLLQVCRREHATWLLFGLAGVNAGFFRRCRVANNVFFWRYPLMILVEMLLAGLTTHEVAVGGPDMLIYAILAEGKKDLLFILHVYAR